MFAYILYTLLGYRHEGSSEFPLQIELAPDSQPSLWKVGEKLEKIIGTKIAPRTVLLSSLWTYVKLHNLQVRFSYCCLKDFTNCLVYCV